MYSARNRSYPTHLLTLIGAEDEQDAYLTGITTSAAPTPFPTSPNAYQTTLNSEYGNVFVTEINTTQSGSQSLVYSTYLGGSTTSIVGDSGSSIAVDSTGKIYVGGDACSGDFPVTSGAYQTTNSAGGKAFVTKFDPAQVGSASLVFSTFLGGTNGGEGEVLNGLVLDLSDDVFTSGSTSSTDFPTTSEAYQIVLKNPSWDAFLTQLNSTGSNLLYSTYFGGICENGDIGDEVALDWNGNPYLDGSTCSNDFPTYPSTAFQTSLSGPYNAFARKVRAESESRDNCRCLPQSQFGWME